MPPLDFLAPVTAQVANITDFLLGNSPSQVKYTGRQAPINGVKDQTIPYLLEVERNGEIVHQYVVPRGVDSWEETNTTRTSVTYTQGGNFVDCIGIIPPKIRLTGTFGYVAEAHKGEDAFQKYLQLDQMVKMLYDSFGQYALNGMKLAEARYYDPWLRTFVPGKSADPSHPPTLRIYDFVMCKYWEVNLDSYQIKRNIQRRHLYFYDLQMTALKYVTPSTIPGYSPPDPNRNTFLAALATIYAGVKNAMAFLIAANQFVGAIKTLAFKAINLIKQITTAINDAKSLTQAIASLPNRIAAEFEAAANDLVAALNTTPDMPKECAVAVRKMVRLSFSLKSIAVANAADRAPSAVLQATITDNDTIHSIASKYRMDWKEVVAANSLTAPYISSRYLDKFTPATSVRRTTSDIEAGATTIYLNDSAGIAPGQIIVLSGSEAATIYAIDGTAVELTGPVAASYPADTVATIHAQARKVLQPGEKITIPATTTAGLALAPGESFEETAYLIDEALDEDGNMISDGDIVVKKGLDNLVMQLKHRMVTIQGELAEVGHARYGTVVPKFVGQVSVPVWHERIKMECEMTAQQDHRISAVGNASLEINGAAVYFNGDAYPINRAEAISVRVPLA